MIPEKRDIQAWETLINRIKEKFIKEDFLSLTKNLEGIWMFFLQKKK